MSYMNCLARVFLGLWLLGLAPALGQEKPPGKPWTITTADLDQILKDHCLWRKSHGKKGTEANLSEANLSGGDITEAELSGVNLRAANLSGANIRRADLSGAILRAANLSRANLSAANLSGANLRAANLSAADLSGANLSAADLLLANLSAADLSGANLSKANLSGADLSGSIFEPEPGSLPGVSRLRYLRGLDSLKFEGMSSYGLMELREIFKKAGMREEERQLTYALNHTRRVNEWEAIKDETKMIRRFTGRKERDWISRDIGRLENIFLLVFFEWTCDYGMTPSRPLLIMLAGLFVFTLPYLLALRSPNPRSGIWLVLLPDRVLDRQIKDRPVKLSFRTPLRPLPAKLWTRLWVRCRKAWRALRLAFYFSLLSAFNLGWRELNVGTWITRIQKREYSLRGTGWVRMISGIQALLSVYLLALWALTYFGRPFE